MPSMSDHGEPARPPIDQPTPLAQQAPSPSHPGVSEQFKKQGYVKVPGFFCAAEVEQFRAAIVDAARRCEAQNPLDTNKMTFYANVFKRSTALQKLISQLKVIDLLCSIAGPDLWIRWDQCVAKAPDGAVFPWHQDNAYNRLKDAHYQFWIALSDMTVENGGLWLQPGSHHSRLPHERVENHLVCKTRISDEVFCAAEKGDVIVFSSLMLHHTKRNDSAAVRWAYVVEYMSWDHYDPLVPPPFFLVAENGVPSPRWANTYRGYARLRNRLKYLGLMVEERYNTLWKQPERALRRPLAR